MSGCSNAADVLRYCRGSRSLWRVLEASREGDAGRLRAGRFGSRSALWSLMQLRLKISLWGLERSVWYSLEGTVTLGYYVFVFSGA